MGNSEGGGLKYPEPPNVPIEKGSQGSLGLEVTTRTNNLSVDVVVWASVF